MVPLTRAQCWSAVCAEFDEDREVLLMQMGNCTKGTKATKTTKEVKGTSPAWLRHIKFLWKNRDPKNPGLREQVIKFCGDLPQTGIADQYFQTIFQDRRWDHFDKLRCSAYHKTTKGKQVCREARKKYNEAHKGVPRTDQQREKRNARDRARYAQQKLIRDVLENV